MKNAGYTVIELLVAIAGIGALAFIIWLGYVAVHFINKYW